MLAYYQHFLCMIYGERKAVTQSDDKENLCINFGPLLLSPGAVFISVNQSLDILLITSCQYTA